MRQRRGRSWRNEPGQWWAQSYPEVGTGGGGFTTVHDAIRRLRPRWLRTRGRTSTRDAEPGMPVFIDNVRSGSTDRLESLPIDQVEQLRYLSPSDATTRWGTNMSLGAIEVIMRKRG